MKRERWEINARKNAPDSEMFQAEHAVPQRDTWPIAGLQPKLNRQGIATYSRQSFMAGQEEMMSDLDIHGKIEYWQQSCLADILKLTHRVGVQMGTSELSSLVHWSRGRGKLEAVSPETSGEKELVQLLISSLMKEMYFCHRKWGFNCILDCVRPIPDAPRCSSSVLCKNSKNSVVGGTPHWCGSWFCCREGLTTTCCLLSTFRESIFLKWFKLLWNANH